MEDTVRASMYKRLMDTALAGLVVLGCLAPAGALAEDILRIGGTGGSLGAMRVFAGAFQKSNPGVKIQVLPSLGSFGGIKAVLNGTLDIGISARELKHDEQRRGGVQQEYAKTPLIFVANRKVTVSGLTTSALEKLYAGEMQSWPGGTRVRLVLRPAVETDTALVKGISPSMNRAMAAALSRQGMIVALTDQENGEVVTRTPGALGISTLAQVITEKLPVKILTYNGVKPDPKSAADGTYPLVKRFFLVTGPHTPPLAQRFIAFLTSPQGRKLLNQTGHLPSGH